MKLPFFLRITISMNVVLCLTWTLFKFFCFYPKYNLKTKTSGKKCIVWSLIDHVRKLLFSTCWIRCQHAAFFATWPGLAYLSLMVRALWSLWFLGLACRSNQAKRYFWFFRLSKVVKFYSSELMYSFSFNYIYIYIGQSKSNGSGLYFLIRSI